MVGSRKKRMRWLVYGVGGLAALFLVLALWPVTTSQPISPTAACMSNVKQLCLGEIMYSQDYGDRLPDAAVWMDRSEPYVRNKDSFRCPGIEGNNPSEYGYAMNVAFSGAVLESVPKPEAAAVLFDSVLLAWNASSGFYGFPNPPRHGGKNNVAYLDGHVKPLKPQTSAPPPKGAAQ